MTAKGLESILFKIQALPESHALFIQSQVVGQISPF